MAGRKIGEIYGEIKIKNQQFNTGLAQTQSKLQGFKMKSVAIFAAITAASYVLIRGMKDIIQTASNLEEQTAKFGTVFRGVIDEANESVKTLTDSYGMSTREARELMAGIQDLLVPMGMMRDEAAGFSFEIVKLATDIGSFNNLPTAEAMEKIKSALVGMYRPMRSVGVVLSDMTVRQKAVNMGLAKSNDEVTALHKAIAAYTMSLEMSKDAQGDFIRTSDDFANSQKILNARIEDLKSTIGIKLLPIIADWMGDFSDLTKEVTKFMEKIGVLEGDTLPALIQTQAKYTQIIERRKYYMDKEDEGLIHYRKLLIEVEKQIKALLDKRRKEINLIKEETDETERLRKEKELLIEKLGVMAELTAVPLPTIRELNKRQQEYIRSMEEAWDITGNWTKTYDEGVDAVNFRLGELNDTTLNMGLTAMDAFGSAVAGGQKLEGVLDGLIAQLVTMAIKFAVFKAIGTAMGIPGGGFFMGMQAGGYAPGKLIPQVSSGYVTQPSVLVGEGKGGELVIPEDKIKGMVVVNVTKAGAHTEVESYINWPKSEKQRFYRGVIKEASDREGKR